MAFPPKKPGVDVMIGVGKGGPPAPPRGLKDAPRMSGMDDQPDEPEQESGVTLDDVYACLKKIEKALGLDDQEPDQSQQPDDGSGSGYGQ